MMTTNSQFYNNLLLALDKSFSREEIRLLCFQLGIDYENLAGETKIAVIQSLIIYLNKRNRIDELIKSLQELRPNIEWPQENLTALSQPYRGLFPFREKDAHFFFGRDKFINRLQKAVQRNPLVAVIGASGCGKSSIVFAGLVPLLRKEEEWLIIEFRPGNDPFHSLASALAPWLKIKKQRIKQQRVAIPEIAKAFQNNPVSIIQKLNEILAIQSNDKHILLIADQFEELYTLCSSIEMQQRFMDTLLETLKSGQATLIFTMRADFMDQAAGYRPFADGLQDADRIILPFMSKEELKEAIEKPAQYVGVDFESGLVARIVDDLRDEPGNLPVLEFALSLLWDRVEFWALTHKAYENIGEVNGALTKYAETVFAELNIEQQKQARQIFMQLVQPGNGTQDTRRLALKSQVGKQSWELVQWLADKRMVVTNSSLNKNNEETVEIIHEALIQKWPRLRGWMDVDRKFREWQETLRTTLNQWEESNHDEGALLRGAPLVEADSWLEERREDLSKVEIKYIVEGIRLRWREKQKERQIEAERRRALQLRGLRNGLAIMLVVAIAIAIIALQLRWEANQARQETENLKDIVLANQLASEAMVIFEESPELALLLTIESYYLQNVNNRPILRATEQSLRLLLSQIGGIPLRGHDSVFSVVDFSPNGQMLASAAEDGSITLWHIVDGDISHSTILQRSEDEINILKFHPNQNWLASGNFDGSIRLWNISKPNEPPKTLTGHEERVWSMVFSPDGNWLASRTRNDNTLILWQLNQLDENKNTPIKLGGHKFGVSPMVFSQDGKWLATGDGNGAIRLWDLSNSPFTSKELIGHERWIGDLEFSSDNNWLISSGYDGIIRLWDLSSSDYKVVTLHGHESAINSIALSNNGRWIASTSFDHTVRLWDISDLEQSGRILGSHGYWGIEVEFSPDDRWLVSSSANRELKLWDLENDQLEPRTLRGHEGDTNQIFFEPNGDWMATFGEDGTIRIWDPDNPTTSSQSLPGHEEGVRDVHFSYDNHWLASAGNDQTVRLWNLSNSSHKNQILRGHNTFVSSVKFSFDNNWLASVDTDGNVLLWRMADLTSPIQIIEDLGLGARFLFSPDNRWLIASNVSDSTFLLDLADVQKSPVPIQGFVGISSISADSRWLVTSLEENGKNAIFIWDINDLKQPITINTEYTLTDAGFVAMISPDGRWIVGDYRYSLLQIWNTQYSSFVLPTNFWRTNFLAQDVEFSPDGNWIVVGSADGVVARGSLNETFLDVDMQLMRGHDKSVNDLAFSQDGNLLATGSIDGTIRLWNFDNNNPDSILLQGHNNEISDLEFSNDGNLLASSSADNIIRLWTVPIENLVKQACENAGRNLSQEEWSQYFEEQPYRHTCPLINN